MQTLHNNDDASRLLVIQPAVEGVIEPLVDRFAPTEVLTGSRFGSSGTPVRIASEQRAELEISSGHRSKMGKGIGSPRRLRSSVEEGIDITYRSLPLQTLRANASDRFVCRRTRLRVGSLRDFRDF